MPLSFSCASGHKSELTRRDRARADFMPCPRASQRHLPLKAAADVAGPCSDVIFIFSFYLANNLLLKDIHVVLLVLKPCFSTKGAGV